MTIRFEAIRPYQGSQDRAFEELICQIAQRTDAANNSTWIRLEGAGGDGGVEAYWYPAAGVKTGLQAKYFTRSRNTDWALIAQSFETALKIHPDLAEYRIYIACNLTGPTGRRGRSGVDHWDEAHDRMKKKAAALGRRVHIHLKTASEILAELARPQCVGLIQLWFGEIEITRAKLKGWLDSAVSALGDRFHPEDHVEVAAQDIVRALSRAPRTREALISALRAVLDCDRPVVPKIWAHDTPKVREIEDINRSINEVSRIEGEAHSDVSRSWAISDWAAGIELLLEKTRAVHSEAISQRGEDRKDDNGLSYLAYRLRPIIGSLSNLLKFTRTSQMAAEITRGALLRGPAGSGKSHLLAAAANEILAEGGVCVMLLGQRFQNEQVWPQISQVLDAPGKSKAEILGALDAAACASRRRGVLILDALNEGPLRNTWNRELEVFASDILKFPNLAFIVSCRDVFAPHVINHRMLKRFPVVEIRGFETLDEQESAALTYLDRRGIARPPVPWLAPEFVNPLFLRSCCLALSAAGLKEIPTGLIGTKQLLAFYVDAVANNLGTAWDRTSSIAGSCKKTLLQVARSMAERRQDWLDRESVSRIASDAFATFPPPEASDWMTVLLRSGVLREDPHPDKLENRDPLKQESDVIRFAFQRFQDHLMSDALLERVTDAVAAFQPDGSLGFVLDPRWNPVWYWNGLIEALAIQIPEKFGVELIDALPGGFERHLGRYAFANAFVQSIKWREPSAITARTLELANLMWADEGEVITLLIELAPRAGHPWNAELLDRNLRRWKLPDRDKSWTIQVSTNGTDAGHPVNRLIDWCATAPKDRCDRRILELSAITLSWFLTSTSATVRDGATKALASIFTDSPTLFPATVERFAGIDDPYIIERVLAAGYGSLVRFPSADKASMFAQAVWERIFEHERVPAHLLVRDYARAIIDIAQSLATLPPEIDVRRTRPPYNSIAPRLDVSQARLKKAAVRAEGEQIMRLSEEWGEFYRDSVERRFRKVTRLPLSATPRCTNRQLAGVFEQRIESSAVKLAALHRLERIIRRASSIEAVPSATETSWFALTIKSRFDAKWKREFDRAERDFLVTLTPEEVEQYRREWLPHQLPDRSRRKAQSRERLPTISPIAASRWIAKRAYSFGWTKKRFGNDRMGWDEYTGSTSRGESIGKKYLRIALSELLARLTDHYWLSDEYDSEPPRRYDYATDLSSQRDIDPTIFGTPKAIDGTQYGIGLHLLPPRPPIEPLNGTERLAWPFIGTPGVAAMASTRLTDARGTPWIRLAWYVSASRKSSLYKRSPGHNLVQSEFSFTHAVLCRRGDGRPLRAALRKSGHVDIRHWDPPEFINGPYLYEITHRATWPQKQWTPASIAESVFPVAYPVEQYRWESLLDASLPEGSRAMVLAAWLMRLERIELDPQSFQLLRNRESEVIAWSVAKSDFGHGIVVRADWLHAVLSAHDLDCLFITVGEREAWNDGDQYGAAAYRRFNCVQLLSNNGWSSDCWNEDHPDLKAVSASAAANS